MAIMFLKSVYDQSPPLSKFLRVSKCWQH